MNKGDWIVIEIGCLECGIPSSLVGRFLTKDEADAFAERCRCNSLYGSDVKYVVLDLDNIEEVIT